jgi:site-specific recombinase XerD
MSKPKSKKTPVPSYESLARLQQMLSLRNLAERSREAYLVYVQKLALHFSRAPVQLDEAQAREYLLHLKEHRKYSPSSMRTVCAALRFFYQFVCEREWRLFDLVRSPSALTLPVVLTREEVQRLIGGVREDRFRVILTVIYGCGLRIGEAVALEVRDTPPDPRGSGRSAFAFPHELVPPTVAPFDSTCLVAGVARRLRIQYPGALYHVINRGN